jgi:WD40 repeat protein
MSAANVERKGTACPKPEELFAFSVGQLSESASETIARHIEACPDCLAVLQELNDQHDPLLAELSKPLPTGLFSRDDGPPATSVSSPTDRSREASRDEDPSRPVAAARANSISAPVAQATPAAGGLPCVPGYQIIEELGRGGMGVVYWAWQVGLNRTVALKMILAGAHAGPEELARFRTEAEAAARLQHPHLIQIHDIGEHEERPYISLEYVDGGSLAAAIKGTPWPAGRAAQLMEILARAVEHAHRQGIVHRDLKPANVLLTKDGQPKITDFGLAKLLVGGGGTLTETGAIMGTPSYMAPEQAAGQNKEIGPATDVYALGAILYELLTGRPPFKAATAIETLHQVVHNEPVPPRGLQPGLPRDLETICLKAAAKLPARRYATARELADDLRRFLKDEPILARPAGMVERALKWIRRRPAAAGLVAIATLLLLGATAGGLWYAQEQHDRAEEEKKLRNHLANQAQASIRELTENSARLRDALDIELGGTGNLFEVLKLLDAHTWRHRPAHRGGWQWQYLQPTFEGKHDLAFSPDGTCLAAASSDPFDHNTVKLWEVASGQKLRTLRGHSDQIHAVVFSPDGRWLASSSWDKTVKLWEVASSRELRTFRGHTDKVHSVTFSPDGRRLASASHDGTVKLWDVAGGQELHTLIVRTSGLRSVAFSPDGTQLASAGLDTKLKLWDAVGGHLLRTLEGHTGEVWSVVFSPDGTRLASASWDKTVKLWDLASGWDLHTYKHTSPVLSVAFSPDAMSLASASMDGTAKVWDVVGGQELHTFRHVGVSSVAFSPDATRLASVAGSVKLWDVVSDQEPPLRTLKGHRVHSVSFGPDSTRLASGSMDGTVKLWDAAGGQELRTFTGHTGAVTGVAFSPDGMRLASASGDKTVKLWDVAGGQELRTFTGHTAAVNGVAFSPDGMRLASASGDKTVKLWDVAGGQELRTFVHSSRVVGLAFTTDGTRLACASGGRSGLEPGEVSGDATVRLWDTIGGQERYSLVGPWADWSPGGRWSMALDTDRMRLVARSAQGVVTLWDLASGRQLRTFERWTTAALSPDGAHLASGDWDGTVKLWDVVGGHELRTLKGHSDAVYSMAFSPDGTRLASVGFDDTIQIYDARPPTAALRVEREAMALVDGLFAGHGLDVVTIVRQYPAITEPVRAAALMTAKQRCENPASLNEASRSIVREDGAPLDRYLQALGWAKAACRLQRENGNYLNTLGIGQYRAGKYAEALATLTRSEPLNTKEYEGSIPADLAFLAMAHFRLSQKEQAAAVLARLRERMKDLRWANMPTAGPFCKRPKRCSKVAPSNKRCLTRRRNALGLRDYSMCVASGVRAGAGVLLPVAAGAEGEGPPQESAGLVSGGRVRWFAKGLFHALLPA